ncbi:MAG: nucleotidyltransferase domain-containing protein [Bacteroidetes bacterium]|nr:nucleotidyltransferase domain-containing protein [Bacteroidota bacterium]MBU2585843.1 nucleotidyltransferase domain-containing protein [Bacteroidota bacterium]
MNKEFLFELEYKIKDLFGYAVKKIILFGSYARGENTPSSDIDVLVIVEDLDLSSYRQLRGDIILYFLNKYRLLISIRIENENRFEEYKDALPFFKNVLKDGIVLYG